MAWLGDLLVRLRAETADFQQDMGKAAQSAERSMQQIQSAAAKLGATLTVGGLALFVRRSIDAADHLHDLSTATAITVEDLAGLAVAAKQSGGDLDSIAASIGKMSVEMGRHSEKFKALGVSASDPLEALKQLADIFKGIEDPELRAAVAATALGKSWQGAAPLLAEGGRRIGEMVEQGRKFSGMTKEIADQADIFNDKVVLLVGSGALMANVSSQLLPILNFLADDLIKARKGAKGLNDEFAPLLEVMKVVVVMASDVSFVFTQMGKDMARAAENVGLIASGQWEKSRELGRLFSEDAKRARAELDAWQKKIMEMGRVKTPAMPAAIKTGMDQDEAAAAEARARAFVKSEHESLAMQKRQIAAVQQMEEKKRSLFNLSEEELMLLRVTTGTYKDFDDETAVRLLNLALEIDRRAEYIKLIDLGIPALQAESDAIERGGEILRDYNQQNVAANDELHAQIGMLGKSAAEQERLAAMRKIDLDLLRRSRDLANAYGDDLEGLASAQEQLNKQAAQQRADALAGIAERRQKERDWSIGSKRAFDDYAEAATNAAANAQMVFGNLFRNMEDALVQFVRTGKLDFKSLADSIISDLIRIQIRAQITGPLAQQAGAGFPALFGGGNNPGGPTSAEGMTGGTFASGGRPPVGAVSLVGEMGPELFVPDVAGTIVPNSELGGMASGNTYYINAPNADAAGLARLQRMLMQMNAGFDARAVAATKQAYAKRGRRSGMA